MLSFGIEYDFAFSTAFWSARLFAGSPPPSFAATMIARESLEKSFPRFASAAPFLCLIDDHLLCPDNLCLPDELQKQFVQPRVVGQLGVERGDEVASLAREHRAPVHLGQHLDVRPDVLDPRRPNEDGAHGPVRTLDVEVRLEGGDLAAERVPAHGHVDQPEVVAVEHDHAGAGAEDRPLERAHRLVEPVQAHQAPERGGLAAREDQPVETPELLGLADLHDLRAEPAQHRRVLAEVPLHGENADPKRLHRRNGIPGAPARPRARGLGCCGAGAYSSARGDAGAAFEGAPVDRRRDSGRPRAVITDGLPSQLPDIDPDETQEWLDSLYAVVGHAGRDRARYLMLRLLERSREQQVGVPSLRSTDYINTIPPSREPWFPGDEHVERRIRAYIRWNAAIMVHRAQRPGIAVGGHISSYA